MAFNSYRKILFLVFAFAAMGSGLPAYAASVEESIKAIERDIKEQRAILQELEKRLQEVKQTAAEENNKAATPETASAKIATKSATNGEDTTALILDRHPDTAIGRGGDFIDPDFSKSVPLFDSDWRFSFGGYAKVDLAHDFSGGDKYEFVLASIPLDGDPQADSFSRLQMNETRLNFEMRNRAVGLPPNRLFIEFDFFDKSSELSTRLRHAYFEYGNLVAGRTWTTLTELRQLPLLLDFAAGDSLYGGRTTQLRWQETGKSPFDWAVALEDYNDAAIDNPLDLPGTARTDLPRLVLRGSYNWGQGVLTVGGSMSQLRFDGAGTTSNVSEMGWALVTGGRLYLDTSKRNFFGFGGSYGEGTANNIISFANGGVPNAVINADGSLDLTRNWNLQFSLHWEWNDRWSSNVNYAVARLSDVPAQFGPDYIRDGRAVHANIIYKVSDVITTGVEFMTGKRKNVDGAEGTAERVQASIFYYF